MLTLALELKQNRKRRTPPSPTLSIFIPLKECSLQKTIDGDAPGGVAAALKVYCDAVAPRRSHLRRLQSAPLIA